MRLTVNKKIVSIAFLVLALFMLLSVSYAYFTAQVKGNEEAKKVEVDAAIMSVKLTGPERINAENLIPSESRSITFQVENTGTVPAIYNLDMIEVINEFDPTSDLIYTITSTNNGGHVKDKEAPTENQTLIRNILILPGKENIQEYTLTLLFKETDINQNSNQNKTFEGRIQINSLKDNSLATRIIRTNKLQTEQPNFTYASQEEECDNWNNETQICRGNWILKDYGSGMFATQDDDGTSYYFRGAVENNNIHFAEMDWKILRINGDGSIRLILNNSTGTLKEFNLRSLNGDYNYDGVGYTYSNVHACTQEEPCISNYDVVTNSFIKNYGNKDNDSIIKQYLEEDWYSENLTEEDDKIALTTFCNDTSYASGSENTGIYYGAYERVYSFFGTPSLKCPNPTDFDGLITHNYGGVYKLKIGLASSDELSFSGYKRRAFNVGFKIGNNHFLDNINYFSFWNLSPRATLPTNPYVFFSNNGRLDRGVVGLKYYIVPVINLKPDVEFTGDGTESNPYTVQ